MVLEDLLKVLVLLNAWELNLLVLEEVVMVLVLSAWGLCMLIMFVVLSSSAGLSEVLLLVSGVWVPIKVVRVLLGVPWLALEAVLDVAGGRRHRSRRSRQSG